MTDAATMDATRFRRGTCLALAWFALMLTLSGCGRSKAPAQLQALLKEKKYEEAITLLETAYASDQKSPELRTELVAASVAYANELTYKSDLPPQEKYPKALRLYRRVLQLDPKQPDAVEGKNLIESIYMSMGRPMPR